VSLLLEPSPVDDLLSDPERWESTLADIADVLITELAQAGTPDAKALGCRLTLKLCQERGGAMFYLPRGDSLRRAVRDLEIWHDYDGTVMGKSGSVALAKRYALSEIHIYRIVARQRGLHRAQTQSELRFGKS
jgi:Mor family transcriptional regulator